MQRSDTLADPLRAATFLRQLPEFQNADRENFVTVYCDQANRAIAVELTSRGSLATSIVHPREVFKGALLANAAAILVAHNHPSGKIEPSKEDRRITERLRDAGALLGIHLLDHIILGEREGDNDNRWFYSFTEAEQNK